MPILPAPLHEMLACMCRYQQQNEGGGGSLVVLCSPSMLQDPWARLVGV